jgi:hypothetical protein
MRSRSALAVLVLLACRPSSGLISDDSALRVSPAELDFGVVALHTTDTRRVTLQNTGPSPLTLHVMTGGPFDTDPELTLSGGSSAELAVRFAPASDGDADGTLDLIVEQTRHSVPLHGKGATCPPIGTCQQPRLDGTTCVVEPAPDGSACTATCLENATCAAGTCVGSARSCADGDACTVDSCDPATGCIHSAMRCPSTLCSKPTCDAQTGCGLEPVADGTSCGDAVCAWADVCIAGACQRKATPNAPLECQYQDVVATGELTCALNLAGHVRCWGGYGWSELLDAPPPQTISPPMALSGFSNEVLIAAHRGLCAVDTTGGLRCGRADQTPSASPVPLAGLSVDDFGDFVGCSVSSTGDVSTWVGNGAPTPLTHAPVKEAVVSGSGLWLLDAMGNLDEWWLSAQSTFPYSARGPIAHVLQTADGEWGPTVLYADGSVDVLWNDPPQPNSTPIHGPGAVAVGSSLADNWTWEGRPNICVAESGGQIICQSTYWTTVRRHKIPGEVVKLTSGGDCHVCALNDRGDIWCWGDNEWGQLDDSQIVFEPRFFDATVSAVSASGYISDGGLYSAALYPPLDGGTQWSPDPAVVARVGDAQFVGHWGFLLSQGILLDKWTQKPLVSGIARCDGRGELVCGDGMGGWAVRVGCVDTAGNPVVVGTTCAGGGSTYGCLLNADGTVDCIPGMTRVALPGPASRISVSTVSSGGCAVLAQGEVRCWSDPTATPQPIPGLQTGTREIEGDLFSGCALTGPQTVQRWGDNSWGQLGQRGPPIATANVRTFDEPIVHLAFDGATVCVQLQSGRAACWGANPGGLLGRTLWRAETPVQIVR